MAWFLVCMIRVDGSFLSRRRYLVSSLYKQDFSATQLCDVLGHISLTETARSEQPRYIWRGPGARREEGGGRLELSTSPEFTENPKLSRQLSREVGRCQLTLGLGA